MPGSTDNLNTSLERAGRIGHNSQDQLDEEDIPYTPNWTHFFSKASVLLKTINGNIANYYQVLSDAGTQEDDIKSIQTKITLHEKKINNLWTEYESAGYGKIIAENQRELVFTQIERTELSLIDLQTKIHRLLPQNAQPPVNIGSSQNPTALSDMVSIIQNIPNTKPVKLPTYAGDSSNYLPFSRYFKFIIPTIPGPKILWATRLYECLEGEAKAYVGDAVDWFDKYDELWEILDSKYGNPWLVSMETPRAFFDMPAST